MSASKSKNKYHICHLTSVHTPFDIRIFRKECKTLSNSGYKISLIAPHFQNENVEGVQIIGLPKTKNRLTRMTFLSIITYRIALSLKADLYHFHDPELIPVGLLLRAKGYKVVYDIHEDTPLALFSPNRTYLPNISKKYVSWLFKKFENYAAAKFSACVTVTPTIAYRFRSIQSNTCIVNNYPILDELISCNPIPFIKRDKAVAFVGCINQSYGAMQMVSAMHIIPKHIDVRLKLIGNFRPTHFRDEIENIRGWDRTDVLGFVSRKELQTLLGTVCAGIVLYHPLPNYINAQPNKLFEYMSAGIPVIASDFPLWRKLIEKESCGILVDPLDEQAISKAIEFMVTHPKEAQEMGQNGRRAIDREYNWQTEGKKLIELYQSML